jgi:hypothetical protein
MAIVGAWDGVGCDCETCVVLTSETQAMSSWKTNFRHPANALAPDANPSRAARLAPWKTLD